LDRYLEVWKKYAVFSGRARRTEFWVFVLVNSLIEFLCVVLGFLPLNFSASDAAMVVTYVFGFIFNIFYIAILVPTLAVATRRLHDTGRSGWWLLIYFVPFGSIVLLVFFCLDSNPGSNQYGPNPKGIPASPYGYPPPSGYQASSATGTYCGNCGTLVPHGSAFCQNCGAKIS
jgi:uncharacterized membrane protein YhaH (DUF805 family)